MLNYMVNYQKCSTCITEQFTYTCATIRLHKCTNVYILSATIGTYMNWPPVLCDGRCKGLQHCLCTVVGSTYQIHWQAAVSIYSTVYDKSPPARNAILC